MERSRALELQPTLIVELEAAASVSDGPGDGTDTYAIVGKLRVRVQNVASSPAVSVCMRFCWHPRPTHGMECGRLIVKSGTWVPVLRDGAVHEVDFDIFRSALFPEFNDTHGVADAAELVITYLDARRNHYRQELQLRFRRLWGDEVEVFAASEYVRSTAPDAVEDARRRDRVIYPSWREMPLERYSLRIYEHVGFAYDPETQCVEARSEFDPGNWRKLRGDADGETPASR